MNDCPLIALVSRATLCDYENLRFSFTHDFSSCLAERFGLDCEDWLRSIAVSNYCQLRLPADVMWLAATEESRWRQCGRCCGRSGTRRDPPPTHPPLLCISTKHVFELFFPTSHFASFKGQTQSFACVDFIRRYFNELALPFEFMRLAWIYREHVLAERNATGHTTCQAAPQLQTT